MFFLCCFGKYFYADMSRGLRGVADAKTYFDLLLLCSKCQITRNKYQEHVGNCITDNEVQSPENVYERNVVLAWCLFGSVFYWSVIIR